MAETQVDKGGRPKANIDWNIVDQLLIAGCSGVEVSSYFGINPHTLYDRCLSDKGIMFSEYSQDKNRKGESILRSHQFAKAIGKTTEGDNTLLIWLGKNRLNQSDNKEKQETTEKQEEVHKKIMDQLDSLQSSLNKDKDIDMKEDKS